MNKDRAVDYVQAITEFDQLHGRKPEDTDIPLKNSNTPDGGVDYLAASQAYQRLQNEDDSDVIHVGEKQG